MRLRITATAVPLPMSANAAEREPWDASSVAQQVPDGNRVLPVGGELRPHISNAQVVAEFAALGQHVNHAGRHALGCRCRPEQGTGANRAAGDRVGDAGSHIGHDRAVVDDGNLDSRLRAAISELAYRFLDLSLQAGSSHRSPHLQSDRTAGTFGDPAPKASAR